MKRTLLTITTVLVIAVFALTACATEVPLPSEIPTATPTAAQPETTPAATAAPSLEASAEPAVPEQQAAVSLTMTGKITELDDEADTLRMEGKDAENAENDLIVKENDQTVVIDAQTGKEVDFDSLRVGDEVSVCVATAMTKSIPPQANAYAIVTNLPENGMGIPSYIQAKEVTEKEDGSLAILNQNADLILTIPAGLTIGVFDENETATAAEIKPGSVLMAWFDAVAMSYPGQATATQVVLVKED